LWALANLRPYDNEQTLKCVYYSFIKSHMQYCASTWGNAPKSFNKPLQVLQNRAIRIITGTPRHVHASLSPLYKHLKILKFEDIIKVQIAKLIAI